MANSLTELEQKVAQMTREERAQLALFLLRSLEPSEDGDIEEAWRVEAEARWAEIQQGEAKTVSSSEVVAAVRRSLH